MRDRFLQQEVWEYMGVDSRVMYERLLNAPEDQGLQRMLFSRSSRTVASSVCSTPAAGCAKKFTRSA